MIQRAFHFTYKAARRIVITAVGATVLLFGVALIFLPGPAFVVIPVGLAILSLEFAFARRWLKKLRETISRKTANDLGNRAEAHRKRQAPKN